jgi:TolA-binding protein
MSEAIIIAIITGGLSLIGVIVSNNHTAQSMDAKLDKQQAITDTKLEELTREVRMHNNFAQRVPVLEEQIKVANHRIADLEADHEKERGE